MLSFIRVAAFCRETGEKGLLLQFIETIRIHPHAVPVSRIQL